ncbi:MAG: HD domain-containing protein [Candidatus Omnitrophica bacterium]|nr:HD domain-containing protein [Candidatus Omnitrophota bacterium]
MSDYAVAIAEALDLSVEETDIMRYASMMHDIGKIGVPDSILDKDGALTTEERKIMQRHTIIGGKLFATSKFPMVKSAGEIALTHHEKYDGTGYPRGLKGKNIPLNGRIVTIADWFDALVSKRSYKKAWSFEEAVKDIEERSGTFFDPDIIKVFLCIKPTLKKLLRANQSIESAIA